MTTQDNKLICIEEKIKTILTSNLSIITTDAERTLDSILINKEGKKNILEILVNRNKANKNNPEIIDGLMYQKIMETNDDKIMNQLIQKLPNGIINLTKFTGVNYQHLQELLINKKFEEADKFTQKCLCELVKLKTNKKKNWLYFTDIQFIPKENLFILDLLWKTYSKGKFGFAIQKKIWLKNNKKWDKLWEKIYWTKNGVMKRYPQEFTWTMDAPEGHLPLFNQLRGTQTLLYLFNNIDW
uniref:GUN4-like domain-containing protein n=1 Tax=Polysiphonia sp. TaxID=1967842 RepID=A0A1Z1M3W5_9FLOR|nr:hypothetical protein [Polysiphonia sp.]